jgi:hypothetical protein
MTPETEAKLLEDVAEIREMMSKLRYTVFGNGKPESGVAHRLGVVEHDVNRLKEVEIARYRLNRFLVGIVCWTAVIVTLIGLKVLFNAF